MPFEPGVVGELSVEIQRLNQFRERVEEAGHCCGNKKLLRVDDDLPSQRKELDYCRQRLQVLEDKVRSRSHSKLVLAEMQVQFGAFVSFVMQGFEEKLRSRSHCKFLSDEVQVQFGACVGYVMQIFEDKVRSRSHCKFVSAEIQVQFGACVSFVMQEFENKVRRRSQW